MYPATPAPVTSTQTQTVLVKHLNQLAGSIWQISPDAFPAAPEERALDSLMFETRFESRLSTILRAGQLQESYAELVLEIAINLFAPVQGETFG